jgi:3-oxoadipate enol-lactonase
VTTAQHRKEAGRCNQSQPDGNWRCGVAVGLIPCAYSLDRLGRDALELLDELKLRHVDFLGLSLGGIIGQWLGIHAPERIGRLVLSITSPYLGPVEHWRKQIALVLQPSNGEKLADMFMRNWFPASMQRAAQAAVTSCCEPVSCISVSFMCANGASKAGSNRRIA